MGICKILAIEHIQFNLKPISTIGSPNCGVSTFTVGSSLLLLLLLLLLLSQPTEIYTQVLEGEGWGPKVPTENKTAIKV